MNAFDLFRKTWMEKCPDITVADVINDLKKLLSPEVEPPPKKARVAPTVTPKSKILILVDEPGLCGNHHRKDPTKRHAGKYSRAGSEPELAKDMVEISSIFRQNSKSYPYVRFGYTSLQPVFISDEELSQETQTRGPVVWIQIPFFSFEIGKNYAKARLCDALQEKMSTGSFDRACGLISTMASGHWHTFDQIIKRILFNPPNLVTVYYENVRDIVVQCNVRDPVKVDPMKEIFDCEKDMVNKWTTLNDMAFHRVVQNRILAKSGSKYTREVPFLSLFNIRSWCCTEDTTGKFPRIVRSVLFSAGNDPPVTPKVEEPPKGIAFEHFCCAFMQAKFRAWVSFYGATSGKDYSEKLPFETDSQASYPRARLFGGFTQFPEDCPSLDAVIPERDSSCRVVYISSKGGFRKAGNEPSQEKNEIDEQFAVRQKQWYKDTLRSLEMVGSHDQTLKNGDIAVPVAKNQPHSDALIVTEWELSNGTRVPGLILDQLKFSDGDASTKLSVADIKGGIDKLMAERGLLFDVSEENLRHGNQVAALGVKEEHVVYRWNVLRDLPEDFSSLSDHLQKVGFKGIVLVPQAKTAAQQAKDVFGPTFADLALLY